MHEIESIIHTCDKAIIDEDFDALMAYYTEDAVLVVTPNQEVKGKVAIKKAFQKIADYFQNGLSVTQKGMHIIETEETALVLAKTVVMAPNRRNEVRNATYVFKKVKDKWYCCVDNSYGHDCIIN